ncbi:MAG: membrane fusion protein (multidrug efflux system) [Planctomycetota bacterium]|jgi:membrane fusion protein (multidrug efflux system)
MTRFHTLSALALLLAACDYSGSTEQTQAADEQPEAIKGEIKRQDAPRVRVSPVVLKEMVRRISTTTAIQSVREIQLQPRMSGVATEILAEEGMRVELGQVLARLDSRDAQAALRDAEVALLETKNQGPKLGLAVDEAAERIESSKLALKQAERNVDANAQAGLISKNELEKLELARDQAQRDLKTTELTLQQAKADRDAHTASIQRAELKVEREQLNLSYTEITAPFAGVIAERMIEVGGAVATGTGAFRLTDPDNVRAFVYRPQRELGFFASMAQGGDGKTIGIDVQPDALPGEVYSGHIQIVSPTIDASSGSFKLTIDLEQPSIESGRPRLLPGMLVRVGIVTERRPGSLVVPKRALRREGERRFLFLLRGKDAVRVDVEEGLADDDEVQVLLLAEASLKPGDRVIVVGNRDLEDGQEVQAEAWEFAPEGFELETEEETEQEPELIVTEEESAETDAPAVDTEAAPADDEQGEG